MYIDIVPNRDSPPAVLLREGNLTRKRTLANLSDWPKEKIETFRRLLREERLVSAEDRFTTEKSLPHGHVQAIRKMIARHNRHAYFREQEKRGRRHKHVVSPF